MKAPPRVPTEPGPAAVDYALTVHKSRGSTIGSVFIDLPDIRRREESNLLEAQQMLYVAATRPSKRLIVVGS